MTQSVSMQPRTRSNDKLSMTRVPSLLEYILFRVFATIAVDVPPFKAPIFADAKGMGTMSC